MNKYIYGVDIGGTNIKFGLFLLPNMDLVYTYETQTPVVNQEASLFSEIISSIQIINNENHILMTDVLGIGMAVPCPVKNNFVEHCPNLNWEHINISDRLKKFLPPHIIVSVSNDATIAALGESQSFDKPYHSVVFYTLGTGVGGGIIIDGKIHEGHSGFGGEIGHMIVTNDPNAVTCGCGSKGCLEQVCGTAAIFRSVRELAKTEKTSLNLDELTVKSVFDHAKNGDSVSLQVVNNVAEYIAISASALAVIVDPEVFIIGGGVSKAGEFLLKLIESHYQKHARFSTDKIPFLLAKSGNNAGFIGAAYHVKKKI
ncbi:MAG: glucokinase [Tenericutes bacterium HGW-Tenericutes-7]|nr:MAG: glucokinase [Tenericutes bacterium HGW-Tenericutes-7]